MQLKKTLKKKKKRYLVEAKKGDSDTVDQRHKLGAG